MMKIKLIGKNKIYRLLAAAMAIIMITIVCAGYNSEKVGATTDAFEQSISGFPDSYKVYLRKLHTKYPNWKFVPFNTGINFSTAVSKEYENNRSLIENAYSKYLKSNAAADYNVSTGKYIAKDGASWVTASKNCIAYFMDPRNFLNDTHIYMFEQLSFDEATQTLDGVEAILQGSFMYKTNINYITTAGKPMTSDITYSKQILDSAKATSVSAYYLASKILQEVGTRGSNTHPGMGASGSVSGTYSSKYTGIYNFYNIGASSSANPILNGLAWASTGTTYERPWNTPFKSILGGAQYIGEKYINCGQNTTYFQRFNVNSKSTYSLYSHQYMTNIYGAASEASYTADAYNTLGIAGLAKTFVIPVYTSMPNENNQVKLGAGATKSGTVSSTVNMRKGPSTEYDNLITLSKGDAVTVTSGVMTDITFGIKWLSNPYWYKINVSKNGKSYTGYVSAAYITLNSEYNVVKGINTKLPITLASSETVYYMSDNPAVATVDSVGNVCGKSNGIVTIRAFTSGGNMSATAVQIFEKGVSIDVSKLTLDVGKKKTLKATVYPTTATNKTVKYSSSNKSVAKVSAKGKITAKAPGTAVITAKAEIGGAAAACRVTVVQPVTGIKLNKTSAKLAVGKSETLKATILPANASNKKIKWKSSNKAVATVSSSGVVKAVSAGTVTITATSKNKKTASCQIKVVPEKVKVKGKSYNYNTVKLSWAKTANISGYWIYRKNSKGKYKIIATVGGNKSSYKDKNLTTGRSYSYKVKAFKTVGKTKYKSAKSTAVVVTPVPGKVKVTSINATNSGAALTWSAVIGASGYEIYRSESSKGTYRCIKTIKKKSKIKYTNTGLSAGKSYYYKVVAYKKASGKMIYGKYSKKVFIKK